MTCGLRQPGKRGIALVLVVFAIAFISVLAIAMLEDATTDLAILRNHSSGLRAIYAAQAGVAKATEALRLNYATTTPISGTLVMPNGATYTYQVTIGNVADDPIVTVTATGTADGFMRKVTARLVVGQYGAVAAPYPIRVVSWREVTG